MKRTLLIVAAAVLLVVLAVLSLPFLVNPDSYKDRILPPLEQALGRKVEVGHLKLSIFGGLGIDLHHVVIANEPQFGNVPLLEAADFQLRIALLPLLKKELVVKRVLLDRPILHVVKNPRGVSNVTVLVPHPRGSAPRGRRAKPEEKSSSPAPFPITALVLSDLVVRDGSVVYVDRSREGREARVSRVSNLNLTVSEPSALLPMHIDFSLSAPGAGRKSLTLSGTLGPLDGDWKNLYVNLVGSAFLEDLFKISPELKSLLPAGFSGSGPAGIRILSTRGGEGSGFRTTVDLSRVTLAAGRSLRKPSGIPMEVRFLLVPQFDGQGVWSLRALECRLGPVRAAGEGTLLWGKRREIRLAVHSEPFPLDRLARLVPVLKSGRLRGEGELAAAVRGSLEHPGKLHIDGSLILKNARARWPRWPLPLQHMEGRVRFTARGLTADGLRVDYGPSPGVLSGRLTDWKSGRFEYRLRFPQLRLPASRAAANPKAVRDSAILLLRGVTATGAGGLGATGMNLNGEVHVDRGSWRRVRFSDLRLDQEIAPDRLLVREFSLRALGGTERGSLRVDLRTGKSPPWFLRADLSAVDTHRLQEAVWPDGPRDKTLRGSLSARVVLTGRGLSARTVLKNLMGSGTVAVVKGRLEGVDLMQTILDHLVQAPALKGMVPALFPTLGSYVEKEGTSFDRIEGKFEVARSSLRLREVNVRVKDLLVSARGSVGFDSRLEMRGELSFSPQQTRRLVANQRALRYVVSGDGRLVVPFRITGGLKDYSVVADGEYLARQIERNTARHGGKKTEERLEKRLPGPLRDLLQDLFKKLH